MKNIIKNGEGLVNERRSLKFWALMSIDILYTALTFSTFLCGEHSLWVLCSLEETQVEKGFQSSSVNLPECAQFVLYEALMEKGFLPDWFLMYTFLFQSPIPIVWSLHTGKHYFHCIILISGTNTSQIYLMMQDLVWFFFLFVPESFSLKGKCLWSQFLRNEKLFSKYHMQNIYSIYKKKCLLSRTLKAQGKRKYCNYAFIQHSVTI